MPEIRNYTMNFGSGRAGALNFRCAEVSLRRNFHYFCAAVRIVPGAGLHA